VTTRYLKRAAVAGASVALVAAMAACGADATTSSDGGGGGGKDCTLKLGTLGPLTGAAADFGLSMQATAKFVASEANAAGGVKVGDKMCHVTVSSYDTGYTSAGAAEAANDFASKGIKFVVGPLGATELTGMKPVAARYGMLLDANGFGRDALEKKYPLVFHLGPGPYVWAGPIIDEAAKHFTFKNVSIIATNDQSGDDIAIVNEEAFKKRGYNVDRETYPRGTTDFAPIVSRLMQNKPDEIDFASSPAGDVGTMIKLLRGAGYTGVFSRLGGDSTAEITKVAGQDTMKNFFFYAPVDFNQPAIKAILPKFKQVTGMDATGIALGWIPGARALLDAISKAGTIDDTAKVAAALRKEPLKDSLLGQGVWTGQQEFGVNQEMSWPFNIGLIENGKGPTYTQLSPEN
jgi:branched-chain amino acid transport system substrate-binding protein